MADHDKGKSRPPVRDGFVHHEISKPVPEKHLTSELNPTMPGRDALLGATAREEKLPGQDIEVEPTKREKGIVCPSLDS